MSDLASVFGTAPPPRKHDILFQPGDDWHANACISHWHHSEDAYSSGYRQAARHLAETVCATYEEQDTLVYPIVYLYRHHIELVLKNITYTASKLLNQDIGKLDGHNLLTLWGTLRPMLNEVSDASQEFPAEDLEGIDSYIRQLEEHDPDGTRFRYATTTKKQPSLKPSLNLINIRIFSEMLEKLADYLGGIDDWFAQLLDFDRDMRADRY